MTKLVCFVCDTELTPLTPDSLYPANGTAFDTTGHYGSDFDALADDSGYGSSVSFFVYICNDCLRKNKSAVIRVATEKVITQKAESYEEYLAR